MQALSAKIVQECTRVMFNTGHPTNPFQKLLLSDFDFIQHTPGPELCYMASTYEDGDGDGDGDDNDGYLRERLQPDPEIDNSTPLDYTDQLLYMDYERIQLRSRHYNGYRSCSAHCFCPFQPVPGSRLCFLHHEMAADNPPDLSYRYRNRQQADSQDTVVVSRPECHIFAQLQLMHQLCRTHTMWVVDTEFCNNRGSRAVAFSISVRDARTGDIVLSTPVDYECRSLDDIEQELVTPPGKKTPYNTRQNFERHYNAEHTHGMSLSALGNSLRRAGFDPVTHVLLSWRATTDIDIIYQALLGHHALLDRTRRKHMYAAISPSRLWSQPFSLGLMVRWSSDLTCTRLGYVFRSPFPDQNTFQMHLADNDFLAMVQILHFFAHAPREWV